MTVKKERSNKNTVKLLYYCYQNNGEFQKCVFRKQGAHSERCQEKTKLIFVLSPI